MSAPAARHDQSPPDQVRDLLGVGPGDAGRGLDFDAALEGSGTPLPFDNGAFELIWSLRAFATAETGWAGRLRELHWLLGDGGRAAVGLAGRPEFERLSGAAWDESRIGMTVLSTLNGAGAVVFHSEWWIRAHWGRAFDVLGIEQRGDLRFAVLRKGSGAASPSDLERPEPGEERELSAAAANTAYLRAQLELSERRHRDQLEDQRGEMERELMRRAFTDAHLEWTRRGPGSPATLIAAEYEATTSWKLTRPLRAVGRLLRREG